MPEAGHASQPAEVPGLRLAEVVAALSLATDFGSGRPPESALRTCVLATRIGQASGLSDEELSAAYYVALLKYIGCTTESHVPAAMFGDELAVWAWLATIDMAQPAEFLRAMLQHVGESRGPPARAGMVANALMTVPKMMATVHAHCEVAMRLADRLGLGPRVQECLGQVFERWNGMGRPRRLTGEAIARPVRVVQLAHDVEVFHRIGGAAASVEIARRRSGISQDPALVERFCRDPQGLCADLDSASIWEAALAAEPGPGVRMTEAEIDRTVAAMADFADLKSPYTSGHSRAVAELAASGARQCGMSPVQVTALRRAGLLHDLGRVGVSSSVWNKAGPLTEGEWERVRLHPYYTERILARPRVLAELGALAALHHERLDGTGYPKGLPAALQSLSVRILACADVYHAMLEPRPHRPAHPPDAAADELRREAKVGRLDGEAVDAVLAAAGHRRQARRHEWPAGLSEREVEVLRLIARGCTNREMASRLSIAPDTVGHHIRHIYDKIDVSTRAGATLFAMQHDLLTFAPEIA